jgi:hypothetical protein
MVRAPVRELAAGFAATLSVTVALPVPEAPEATVIHAALLDALQAHPAEVLTATAVVPPEAATEADDVLSE